MVRISEWYEKDKCAIFVSFVHSDLIRVTSISPNDSEIATTLQEWQGLNKNSRVAMTM
jgi:hypothetical protein